MEKPIFKPEYFYDEVRDGFYISEMMKRFWAAQIMVLYEIVKICDRHSIPWYADMGTLLGAIRHKGYVPWDDDLDISMNRRDWERFFEYAQDELPEEFHALSVRTDPEFDLSLGRICNSHGIHLDREHLEKFCGCPYSVGVDVYPIDRLYKEPEKEQERKNRGKAINRAFELMALEGMEAPVTRKVLADIERDNHVILHRKGNLRRELILLFEKICMECDEEDYDEVALMNTWILGDWANCPRYLYEEQTEVPFENITLKATAKYDELLTIYYHDYMTVYKGGGAHEYPVYRSQEQTLVDHVGHNPYRYSFSPEDMSVQRKEKTFREKCDGLLGLMTGSLAHITSYMNGDGDRNAAIELLGGCQNVAVMLGELLEGKYGEGCAPVKELEEYCELLYQASELWSEEVGTNLGKSLERIRNSIQGIMETAPKEILFIPCRSVWWDTMKPFYESECSKAGVKVSVMPIPYYDKNPYGEVGKLHDDSDFFKGLEGYTDHIDHDLEKEHPDCIVIQVPFDGYSCAMTVTEGYFSSELLKCCDELVYIPCLDPDPPIDTNDKASSAIAVLVEQPAVFSSDRIILPSEEMKDFYRVKLAELTGNEYDRYWDRKIDVMELTR